MLLNAANAVYLGTAKADRVYLGSNLVYQATVPNPPGLTEHSVFGVNPPSALTSYDDALAGDWLGQQFYSTTTDALSVVGVRIYVPPGSFIIGKLGHIALQRRTPEFNGIWKEGQSGLPTKNEFNSNGSKTPFSSPLVAGWNDFHLATAYPMLPGDGIILAYTIDIGVYYLYSNSAENSRYTDVDGIGFVLAEAYGVNGQPNRSVYNGQFTQSRWYGLDILVTKP